jgi:uncharacterized protein YcbK (DUF882 family)
LGVAAGAAATASFSTSAMAMHLKHHHVHAHPLVQERAISMISLHTRESTSLVYWRHGKYLPHALHHINHVMRDHYNNKVHRIDPRLLDLLHDLHRNLGGGQPFHLVCGYRSPQTNAWLHRTTGGVAVNSLHLKGQAADVQLPGVSLERLHNAALHMARGGVGYYPRSDFVHVDTGRVRQWEYG